MKASNQSRKVKKRISVEGELEEFCFPRVFLFLHERLVTGRLVLRKGELTKVVFLVEGKPVNVDSTLREETLGRYLVRKGKISEEDFERSIELMIEQGLQQGAALVKLGRLSPRELYHEVKAQTFEKFISCFGWTTGSFGFYPEVEFVEDIYRFEISVPLALKEGIWRFFPPGAVERELAKLKNQPLLPTDQFLTRVRDYDFSEEESAFLLKVDGERDLVTLKNDESCPQAAKLVYLLLLTGLVGPGGKPVEELRSLAGRELVLPPIEEFVIPRVEETAPEVVEEHEVNEVAEEPSALLPESPAATEPGASWSEEEEGEEPAIAEMATPLADETSLAELEKELEPAEVPPAVAEEVSSETTPASANLVEEEVMEEADFRPLPQTHLEIEEEEIFLPGEETPLSEGDVLEKEEAPESASSAPEEEEAEFILRDESELLEFYMSVKSMDFFTLLGLPRQTDDAEVVRAYRRLRAEYDKSKFARLSAEALAKLEEIQTQIIRAYEALRTEADRNRYLALLEKKEARPAARPGLQAEKFLQKGLAFVRQREWAKAQEMFEQAVAARPEEPEYRGYLGWTIYCNSKLDLNERREKAKALIRQAIEMNPTLDSSHVFLGKVLKEEGKTKEAVLEFQTALRLNPKCREAERELRAREQGEW